MPKSVCYFGSFDPDYSRNRIIIKGLQRNNIEVQVCNYKGKVIFRHIKLLIKFIKIQSRVENIIVGFPGYLDIQLAFMLSRIFNKKLFFDVFATRYETLVLDRGYLNETSWKGRIYYYLDLIGIKLCDVLVVDTQSHLDLYKKLYKLKTIKSVVVYVGSDSEIFYPTKTKTNTDVMFYGSFQPLQGVESIVEAAYSLPKVKFKIIGNGQTRPLFEKSLKAKKLKNVKVMDWIPLNKLVEEINASKIMLGIFGNSAKARAVIPNKVYDALACGKPVITSETSAMKEIFKDRLNVYLVKSDSELTKGIKDLLTQKGMYNKLSREGLNILKEKLIPEKVVMSLINLL